MQLLEKNVGDTSLFKALVKVYDLSRTKNVPISKIEDALWKALDVGFDQFDGSGKDHLMIVIDGVDAVKSSEGIQTFLHQLGLFTSKHSGLQAVTLSREPPPQLNKGGVQQFKLKADHTYEDLRHIAGHAFHGYQHFKNQSEHKQELIVEQLVEIAQGNFLWLLLTIFFLRKETSHEAFEKAVKVVKDAPKPLSQTITRIVETAVDLSRSDAYLISSWMLVAQRPLTVAEIKALLQIDLQKGHNVERKGDIRKDIHAALGPLVLFQTILSDSDILRSGSISRIFNLKGRQNSSNQKTRKKILRSGSCLTANSTLHIRSRHLKSLKNGI